MYAGVTGWNNFEPWMDRLEKLDPQRVWEIAEGVPPEWYGGVISEMDQLVEKLLGRRERVPELIEAFRESSRNPFPNWMRRR